MMVRHAFGTLKVLPASAFLALLMAGAPKAEAAFYNGPYLQQVTQTSVMVMWETDAASTGSVKYGTSTAYGQTVTDSSSTTLHTVVLKNLQPQTVYYFSVAESSGSAKAGKFMTAPKPGADFTFAAYGDSRSDPTAHQTVANGVLSKAPSLVVTTGDYAETTGIYRQWHNQFFVPAGDMLLNIPILPAVGNHDSEVGHPRSPVYQYFPRPGSSNYYSFDYGDIHFVIVDSNISYSTTSAQYAWLQGDLAATTQPYIIAVHHYPVYSSGNHGSTVDMDATLRPLYEAYGVNVVLNGHDHMYERSVRNGITYFVLGGGGADLYSTGDSPNPYAVKSESTYNYGIFTYKGGTLSLTAYRSDGSVIETVSFSGTKRLARPVVEAVEAGPEDEASAGCSFGGSGDEAAGAGVLSVMLVGGLLVARRRRR
jgi:predicted phosphodiesterase